MRCRLLRPFRLLTILVLPLCLAPSAQAHQAKDLLDQQSFSSTPPKASSQVQGWIDWARSKQGGDYERTGGQPFAAPVPPNLPSGVTDITILVRGGSYTESSGGVTCTRTWSSVFVLVKFSDGTQFVWMVDSSKETCSDGSSWSFSKTIGSAAIEDPLTQAWSGWIRSGTVEDLATKKAARFRAPAGGTLDLTSLDLSAGPWVGAEYDEVEIAVGPGGLLDLRGNSAAGGPIFSTSGPVLLRCDQILMDPGVQLADMFVPPPIVLPGAVVHGIELLGPDQAYFASVGVYQPQVRAVNTGNGSTTLSLLATDPRGWLTQVGPVLVNLQPFQPVQGVALPVFMPPAAQVGDTSPMLIQASAPQTVPATSGMLLVRVDASVPPVAYCTAKINSLGCTPSIGSSGAPTSVGYDDFHVLASGVLNGMNGILFWGPGAKSVPFQGGTLCVQGPVLRTPAQSSGGQAGSGSDCSGLYSLHFSQGYLQAKGLVPGSGAYCQFWTRDPAASFGSGLSDALSFVVAP